MPSFRTKRGHCRIDEDSLSLEASLRGQLRRYREGNRVLFWSYVLVLVSVVVYPLVMIVTGSSGRLLWVAGGVVAVVGVGYVLNRLRGFTRADEIPTDAITQVTAVEGTKGLTRPRFVVTYETGGETKHRYVLMPSKWLSYADEEFEDAKSAFRDLGIPVEG